MMKRFNYKTRFSYKAHIDLTALIDVVFLLVAFFMVTSSLGKVSSITVNLPRAAQSGNFKNAGFIISITDKNEIFVNDKKYTEKDLFALLKEKQADLKKETVVIRGDKKSQYETIVKVMDYLNRAEIPVFTLATIKNR